MIIFVVCQSWVESLASPNSEIDFDSPVIAILDACTLVPSSVRDVLLRCAAAEFFQVRWGPTILEEVRRTLSQRIAINDASIDRLFSALTQAFPDAMAQSGRPAPPDLIIDPEDSHVVEAALAGNANVIVTRNVRHFVVDQLQHAGIQLRTPDQFLVELFDQFPQELLEVIAIRAADLHDSRTETLEFLRQHMPEFVRRIETDYPNWLDGISDQ